MNDDSFEWVERPTGGCNIGLWCFTHSAPVSRQVLMNDDKPICHACRRERSDWQGERPRLTVWPA